MYKLVAISQYGREVIDEDLTKEEARTYANEYRMAYGPSCTIKIVRKRKKKVNKLQPPTVY